MKRTALALAVVLSTVLVTQAHSAELLGLYEFEGNALDTGGQANHATQFGAVPFVAGFEGQAASFSGNSANFFRAPINASPTANATVTWGAWVKLNNPAIQQIPISNDNGGWDRFPVAQGGQWGVSAGGFQSSGVPATTDWALVTQTFDGTNQQLFINGAHVLTRADPAGAAHPHVEIGRNANGAGPINGLVDTAFVFNDKLTNFQVSHIQANGANGVIDLKDAPATGPIPVGGAGRLGNRVEVGTGGGLLGFYPFDGNANDAGPAGNNGTVFGTVTYDAGFEGQAAEFQGNIADGVRVPINTNRSDNPTVTWGAWVESDVSGGAGDFNTILSNDNGGWDRFTIGRNSGPTDTNFGLSNGGGWTDSGVAFDTTDFQFVAVTMDGTTARMFIDSDTPVVTAPDTATGPGHIFTEIGRNADGNASTPWDGLIDNAFIFDRVLTDAEIAQIRAGGSGAIQQIGTITSTLFDDREYLFEIDADTLESDHLLAEDAEFAEAILDLNGADLGIELFAGTYDEGDEWQLLVADEIIGEFDNINIDGAMLPSGLQFDFSGLSAGGDGILRVTAVPEPASVIAWLLVAGTALMYGWRRWRKR